MSHSALLAADEPPPFEIVEGTGRPPAVFVCDHASLRFPRSLNGLGLADRDRARHIAWDIGAAAVARALAARFSAPAVLAGYSRLVIDCNRSLSDPTSIPVISDGTIVPGNRDLDPQARDGRIAEIFHPYHAAVQRTLKDRTVEDGVPALVCVHSYAPRLMVRDEPRPWQIGVLWDRDPRMALPLMAWLAERGVVVGDNEPYSGRDHYTHTVNTHAAQVGRAHVSVEIRQDLIEETAGAERWTGILGDALATIFADERIFAAGCTKIATNNGSASEPGRTTMDEATRIGLEAAAFRRLVAHLRERTDVQNIDLMNLAGFCRNCLSKWYREAAEQGGMEMAYEHAREIVYGMPYEEWKTRYQKEAGPDRKAAFAAGQASAKR